MDYYCLKNMLKLLATAADWQFIQKSKKNAAERANVTYIILKLELFNSWTTSSFKHSKQCNMKYRSVACSVDRLMIVGVGVGRKEKSAICQWCCCWSVEMRLNSLKAVFGVIGPAVWRMNVVNYIRPYSYQNTCKNAPKPAFKAQSKGWIWIL